MLVKGATDVTQNDDKELGLYLHTRDRPNIGYLMSNETNNRTLMPHSDDMQLENIGLDCYLIADRYIFENIWLLQQRVFSHQ